MSLPKLIEDLSPDGMLDKDALDAAIELMKIEKLKEILGEQELDSKKLARVLKVSKNLPTQEKIAYSSMVNLSKREKECFLKHTVEGMSMQKIADELGIVKSTVHIYIIRARKKIAEKLQET